MELLSRVAVISVSMARLAVALLQKDYGALPDVVGAMGPTYVKFGQALASRSDIVGRELAGALAALQDDLPPFPDDEAAAIVEQELPEVSCAIRGPPVAAASLCQVYRGWLRGREVAIKVQRPRIRQQVAADALLLRWAAGAVQGSGAIRADAVGAVDEFVERLFEEMDFENEAANLRRFRALYGKGGSAADVLPPPGVRVPELLDGLVSRRVLVMEWLQGEKLTERSIVSAADLPLVELGIRCTLSQLIETGVMHADPHGGNLLKLPPPPGQEGGSGGLAYLDFGLVSEVPQGVRDGLVGAVALLVFARDYPAVAALFGELMLIPLEVVEDPVEMRELAIALSAAAEATLVFPSEAEETTSSGSLRRTSAIPDVRFDQLLGALASMVPRFRFVLPPYFVNNARALGTLEGMARSADPSFNIVRVVYPFAIRRLLANPTGSPVLRTVVRRLASDCDGRLSLPKLLALLNDAATMSDLPRLRVAWDALTTREGRALAAGAISEALRRAIQGFFGWLPRAAAWLFRWRRRNNPTLSSGPRRSGGAAGAGPEQQPLIAGGA